MQIKLKKNTKNENIYNTQGNTNRPLVQPRFQEDKERRGRVFFPLKLFAKRKSTFFFFFFPANGTFHRLLSRVNLPVYTACQMRDARDIASATRVNAITTFFLLSCRSNTLSLDSGQRLASDHDPAFGPGWALSWMQIPALCASGSKAVCCSPT